MTAHIRKSGINVLGDIPWGSHFCLFHQTKDDLLEMLLPYFQAGLESNEFCIWIVSAPLRIEEAKAGLAKRIADFDGYLKKGQIEIIPDSEWYLSEGRFDPRKVLAAWTRKHDKALASGYDGMRATGDMAWVGEKGWKDFINCERAMSNAIGEHKMLALCSYALERNDVAEIIDMVSSHRFILIRREGRWALVDNSERESMEQHLLQAGKQQQAILNNIPDIAWLKDRDSRFIVVNEAFGKACGVRPEDLTGKTDLDIWPRELADRYRRDDKAVMRSGVRQRVEEPLANADGTTTWIETIKTPVVNGEGRIVGTAGIARDFTEAKHMREKIEHAAAEWRNTFDSISDMISIHDLSYRITRVNMAFASAFGMKPAELIGRTWYELFHETKGPHLKCPGEEAVERGEAVRTEYFEPRLGRYLEVVASPFRDEKNEITGFVHISKDITEKKKVEKKALQSEKLAAVGKLASGVAHEIRNPLANISATAQYCLGKYELDKPVRKHMDVIVRNSESANSIIKDLLEFAKPHSTSFRMCFVREVIKNTCELIKPRCSVNRVRVRRRLARRLPSALMDPERIGQALMNFMINAIDAMPQGGTLIVTAESDPDRKEIVITIADTGKGIPEAELPKIFNPFFSTKREGVGLGLSLAHQIISQHNGSIDVHSEVGKGTTVTVRLPVTPPPPPPRNRLRLRRI
ncbi:MAG: MEDS domain-containing protein [Candidatus Aureabacteria bacterium]|nr:MEDS domain-containing protein [Candidatus Auribacterota bacterium]